MSVVTPIIVNDVCQPSRAGIRVLWAIGCASVTALAIDPDTRTVVGMALADGAEFSRIEFEKDTASLVQEKTVNKSSVNYVQLITIYEPGLSNEVRNALEDLNQCCCLHIIVEDNEGQRWYCGITYFPMLETWQTEDMKTGEGSALTGADPSTDSAEYLETFLANTFNYALLTTIDPDDVAPIGDVWGTDVDAEVWGTDVDAEVWGFG